MPWLKLVHIAAVIVWCGTLLYLPALIASAADPKRAPLTGDAAAASAASAPPVLRLLFTLVVTPAALVAIASGTVIFVFLGPLTVWLVAKLVAVGLLVLAHAVCGLLVLKAERGQTGLAAPCAAVAMVCVAAMLLVAWLVLGKPF
ncbi:CopD family protein [Paracidovorax sp. MALMAid1276]|uniref:CopD family protein n=1 Tax=Paracidovorax sp. MALMAid1276 TaxID=3411631 RepID=UPI003B9A5F8D